MARRPFAAPAPSKDGPRVNEEIRGVPRVLLIDENGEKQGEMPITAALEAAAEVGLDLVEVAPMAEPPVCKIMDFGKFRFQEQKKKAEARKNAKAVEIKEIKVRPNIDDHDYDVKMRAIHRFFEEGDKVKVTLRFRGRELAHTHLGMELLERIRGELDGIAKVEQEPRFEGRQVVMVMAPRNA
ncbi:MAG: translation initiation factor IF-3 [Alphaproteobacteria bacterium]|nr:translation initiation factor IF-3 [Alphaproteobacteria bacterium]